ncbi:MAG: tetratricopeptide repeat protein [Lentisphaerae bacterium]|nr:tetratricopeptide repeat protein [Lentisphaerota bacterium]
MGTVLGCLPGCVSPGAAPGIGPSGAAKELKLTEEQAALASALAHFGLGVLRETLSQGTAVDSYRQALEEKPDYDQLYIRPALIYLKQGQADQAISMLEEACRKNPRSLETYLYLAQIYQSLNRSAEAIKTAQRAIRIHPRNSKGYIQLAFFYLNARDEERALATLEDARKKADDKLPVLRFLGDLYAQKTVNRLVLPSAEAAKAIGYYEEAAALPPDNESLRYLELLGDLYLLNRQADQALGAFQKLAARRPNDTQIQKKLAVCYLALGQKDQAVESLKAVLGQEPQNSQVQFYLGELYETLGDTNRALISFRSAVDTLPATSTPYLKLVFYYLKLEPAKAAQVLQNGLQRFPEDKKLLEMAIPYYLQNQQPLAALECYVRLQNLAQHDQELVLDQRSLLFFGELAQQQKLSDLAAALFEKALDLSPDLLEAYIRLAFLYLDTQAEDEALNMMNEAVQVRPDDPAAWYYFGLLYNRLEVYDIAISAFARVEALSPKLANAALLLDSLFFFNYGAACERTGALARAEELLLRAMRLDPENAEAFNYLAYMWAEKGIRLEQALEYSQHALDCEPDNGAFLDTFGWILYKQNQPAEALSWIQAAHYFMADDPTILEHLGDVWAALGNTAEALDWWQRSYRLKADNKSLADKLRRHGGEVNPGP